MLAGAVAGLTALGVRQIDGPAERMSIDVRFAVRGHRTPSHSVAIVAFDNRTLRSLNIRPPVPRDIQARVIDHLDLAGARVIGFDYSLEEPSGSQRQDRAVVVALLNARHAVVSVTAPGPRGDVAALAGFVPFDDISVRPGYTPLQLDPQGVVRQFTRPPKGLETFSVAAAEEFTGDRGVIPPANALIDYPGPTGTFPQLSYVDVFDGHFDRSVVRGRIVIVGPTATVLEDGHRVPVDSTMPGPEIHAAAISTVLDGFPLRLVSDRVAKRTAFGAGFLVPLLLAGLALVSRRIRSARGGGGVLLDPPATLAVCAVGATTFAAWLAVSQLAFNGGTVVEVPPALAAIAASTTAAILVTYLATKRAQRTVRERFAAREPGIVQQVLASGGRRRAVTASDIIAGYTIEDRIAGGGMGEVYRATQTRLGRQVALKVIRAEYALDRDYRRRFVDEAYRAARISHPNIVPVIDAGEADGVLFIAMQYIEGSSLGESLRNVDVLDAPYAVRLVHRVACALDAAHAEELFHRDVKPGNILIPDRSPQHPFLTDFGVAGVAEEAATRVGVEGTMPYLAPERFDGRDSGRAADVYALAAVLYQCLTGRVPFPFATPGEVIDAHRNAHRPGVTVVRTELPSGIDAVIATGMAISPTARHPTATAFTRAAAQALEVEITDDEPTAGESFARRPRPVAGQPGAIDDDGDRTEPG